MNSHLKNIILFIVPAIMFGMMSCKTDKSLDKPDLEIIEENVRSYFFMGDTVDLEVSIADTIYSDELEDMLAMLDTNLMLIQQDIDTVNSIIDALSYADKEESNKLSAAGFEKLEYEALQRKNPILEYKLKLKELEYKKLNFQQSNRIYLHLKRSTWANISGFEVDVHYKLNDEEADLKVLMDAEFNVVD